MDLRSLRSGFRHDEEEKDLVRVEKKSSKWTNEDLMASVISGSNKTRKKCIDKLSDSLLGIFIGASLNFKKEMSVELER